MVIKERLEQEVAMWEQMGHPALMQRFVLRKGVVHTAAPYTGKRGTPKECFCNAAHLTDGTYAEGYAWRAGMPILVHHAWRVRADGTVIDPTWDRPEECSYMGVEFTDADLWRWLKRIGTYGLLDTTRGLNTILMFGRDPDLRGIAEQVAANRLA